MPRKLFVAVLSMCFAVTSFRVSAQEDIEFMQQMEDSLMVTADSMYNAFLPDDRPAYVRRFVRQLVSALKTDNSWKYEFPKLKEEINITYPEDNGFRLFNWVIATSTNTRRYYGAIQMPSEELKLYPLVDYSMGVSKCLEDEVMTSQRWFGGLIYRIIPHEVDGETVYTLFTMNSASPMSNKKVLDPMRITDDGPIFGAQIFELNSSCNPEKLINRFVIEYKKDVQASMNWDAEYNAIVFDRLVSQVNDPNRKYTYVPSGQYDGFKWKGGKWTLVKDLIPIDIRENGNAPTPSPIFKENPKE